MLDALVTMVAFLMFTMSVLNVVSIESVAPITTSARPNEDRSKPLQLTLSFHKSDVEIWSPFDRISARRIPNNEENKPHLERIHSALVEIKQSFPKENKIVFSPLPSTPYDSLISVMDSARMLEDTDPTLFAKNPKTGVDEVSKLLFPDIVFGNLLGDG